MTLESHLQSAGFTKHEATRWRKEVPWFYVQIEVQPTHYAVTLGHKEVETIDEVELEPPTFDLNTYEFAEDEYRNEEIFALHCLDHAITYANEKTETLQEKGALIRTIFQDTLCYAARTYPTVPEHQRNPAVLKMLARILTEQEVPHYLAPATLFEMDTQYRAVRDFRDEFGKPEGMLN